MLSIVNFREAVGRRGASALFIFSKGLQVLSCLLPRVYSSLTLKRDVNLTTSSRYTIAAVTEQSLLGWLCSVRVAATHTGWSAVFLLIGPKKRLAVTNNSAGMAGKGGGWKVMLCLDQQPPVFSDSPFIFMHLLRGKSSGALQGFPRIIKQFNFTVYSIYSRLGTL